MIWNKFEFAECFHGGECSDSEETASMDSIIVARIQQRDFVKRLSDFQDSQDELMRKTISQVEYSASSSENFST